MSRLLLLQVLALTASLCLGQRIVQRCKLDVDITCPSASTPEPSVSCSAKSCIATGDSTWYIGVAYERISCLTPVGLMVKVAYGKGYAVECSLVPLASDAQLLAAYTAADVCVQDALDASSGGWSTPNPTPAPTTVAPTLTCPAGWHIFGSSCFQVTPFRASYQLGQDYCIQNGGNIASIRSPAENNFLATIVTDTTFFGLTDDITEGEFFWADEALLAFENWSYGEPNNYLDSEDCTVFGPEYYYAWNDVNCKASYYSLCRIPAQ